MKIRRLRLAGFGPYKDEQVVDFEQFDRDGIFLISGRTGAGKSSILDAICFALYNAVPRYDGRDAQLRSHYCGVDDPSYVEVEFSLRGEEYRIWRTPEYLRPAKRGGGLTPAKPEARLEIREADGWRGLAASPKAVGLTLAEILPIREDQFLQVILLAQNRFQRFLLAKTDERRAVLRTLFGTARFEKLETALIERRKVLETEVAAARQTVATLAATVAEHAEVEVSAPADLDWFSDAAHRLGERLVVAAATADTARAAADNADRALRAAEDLVAKQLRRSDAEQKLQALNAEASTIDAAREALAEAARAEIVAPALASRAAALAALDRALAAEKEAEEAWLPFAAGYPEGQDLALVVDQLSARLGALDTAIAEEASLPGLERDVLALTESVDIRKHAVQEREARIAALPRALEALEVKLAAASVVASTQDDRRGDVTHVKEAHAAAQRADKLRAELSRAEDAERTASKRNIDAAVAYDALIERRHADIASELAASLVPGEACMVCGSTAHPSPAPAVSDPITPEAIERAKAALGEQQRALAAATARVTELTAEVAEARAHAGGLTTEEAVAARELAEARYETAKQASRERTALETEKTRLRASSEQEHRDLESDRVEFEALSARLTEATVRHHEAADRVATQRGDFPTVRTRAARLQEERSAARTLLNARESRRRLAEALESTEVSLTSMLTEQSFADAHAAMSARLAAAELEALRLQIRRHDDAAAAARSVLAEPGLAQLPAELVTTDGLRERVVGATDTRDAALRAHAELQARARLVQAKVAEAEDLFGRSARLLDEYEQVRGLAAAVHGDEPNTKRMRLETFVLAAQLEQIIAAANLRLRTMTDGRYTLLLDDEKQYRNTEAGLGLTVLDEHTGQPRQTASLSGGEMFLASLSLALGLAEVVSQQAGGIRLDTLFVDEGFGSLDSETLEVAMHALDSLRSGGRTIGLISHVDSMKEQIPAKLAITVKSTGESVIESSYAMA